jgi:hypothetical protein
MNASKIVWSAIISFVATLVTLPVAIAEPDTSYARVSKLYSTMDGWYQAVELELVTVGSSPLALGGRMLTVRDRSGNVRSNRPLSSQFDGPIQRPYLLLATFADDDWDGIASLNADVQVAGRLLPIDGGTIEIEGMDTWTFGALPLTGVHALARDGSVVPAILNRYMRVPFSDPAVYTYAAEYYGNRAVEYYHAGMDHYFVTAMASEQEMLESGQIPGWKTTWRSFGVLSRAAIANEGSKSAPVCRFLKIYPDGYTHFLSPVAAECSLLSETGFGILESDASFHVAAADPVTGECPKTITFDQPLSGTQFTYGFFYPVYRLWNGKAEANHRLVREKAQRDFMVSKGWVSEGYGPHGVSFCTSG